MNLKQIYSEVCKPSPLCSAPSVEDPKNRTSLFRTPGLANILPEIDSSRHNRIHSSLTAVHGFDDGYVGKQPVACKEYCMGYWFKELQESMDCGTGCSNEVMLKTALS